MRRLGVLGWPVAHSRSPAMHTAALAQMGLGEGWSYQRLPVPPELFAETVRGLPGAGFVGANVTIPHKEAALALADTATPAARAIGAANTLSFSAEGAIHADNTDAPGLIATLPWPVRGRTAVVLGAGGSARGVAWALRDAGAADVAVWNRSPQRAQRLAADLDVRAVEVIGSADLLVNCTSVGLHDVSTTFKELPLSADAINEYSCLVDLVYRDGDTALIGAARDREVSVVDGLEILVHQGALSLEAWTGVRAPIDAMRDGARGIPPH
ncbi:Shikimate dehydrogenase (NADP(+)) [Paraconexibacter sp. AEG42_29]|uniref:Shikimate dehydrogenase (NADP(+)) n=1 Tax=Paraconexibacter sp. AEG42_29 TaxID=2997339 RepID=A0AAU7AXU1_9ACTN